MDYQLRPAEIADMDQLMLLIEQHTTYERAPFDASGKKDKLISALFGEIVKLNCLVVEKQGKLAGFATYTFDFSTWDAAMFMYMDCLFLTEGVRGLGIGTLILQKLEAIARENNCVNIQWQTPDFNEPAIRFYHKNKAVSKNKVRFTLNLKEV